VTLLPDEDRTPDLDGDADEDPSTLLGVVQPPLFAGPAAEAEHGVRRAATEIDSELERLRQQRADRDRTGLAEINDMRQRLIADRQAVNARIKALVAEQARLARVLRVFDA
jgi:hypothetical protein